MMRQYIFLFGLFLFAACGSKTNLQLVSQTGFAQGTTYSIRYLSPKGKDHQDSIRAILTRVDQVLSTYQKGSIINAFNANDSSFKSHPYFNEVLKASLEIAKETQGKFDPTLAPLIKAWGFGAGEKQSLNQTQVDSLLRLVGYYRLRFDKAGNPVKENPNLQVNFNAIAQGYTVDLIAECLEELGIQSYMVEIGGEIKCKGKNPDHKVWRIGIDKPKEVMDSDRFQTIIELKDASLATSGNYRKFEVDSITGIRYSHTIDPASGYPVRHKLLSVSVITKSCMEADAYATAMMVMGPKKAKQFLDAHPEIDAMLIMDQDGDYEVFRTPGFKETEIWD